MQLDDTAPLSQSSLLIIEDDKSLQEMLAFFVAQQGAAVDVADNGQIGLDTFLANPNKYDAILLDINMPVMGGLDVARHIRSSGLATCNSIPIVFMSGNIPDCDILEQPAAFYLKKPFDIFALSALLVSVLQCLG